MSAFDSAISVPTISTGTSLVVGSKQLADNQQQAISMQCALTATITLFCFALHQHNARLSDTSLLKGPQQYICSHKEDVSSAVFFYSLLTYHHCSPCARLLVHRDPRDRPGHPRPRVRLRTREQGQGGATAHRRPTRERRCRHGHQHHRRGPIDQGFLLHSADRADPTHPSLHDDLWRDGRSQRYRGGPRWCIQRKSDISSGVPQDAPAEARGRIERSA